MGETYTFSRALHLMRYSGKKMRSVLWEFDGYMSIYMDSICITMGDFIMPNSSLESDEILGSWIEVKE